jgi:glutaminase
MATAGPYETSGEWLNPIGLPGKSGTGGGIVMVTEDGGRRLNNTGHELRTVR